MPALSETFRIIAADRAPYSSRARWPRVLALFVAGSVLLFLGTPVRSQAIDPKVWPELDPAPEARRPLADTTFERLPNGFGQKQLARWVEPVGKERSRLFETTRSNVLTSGFEGLLHLRAPWPGDAVLRLAPFDHSGLALYFWKGTEGIALQYIVSPRPAWVAYQITRAGKAPRPESRRLVTTDDGRASRTLAGTIDVRFQKKTLVVSQGDVRLITAPFSEPPADVYFDHGAKLRQLTMFRSEPLPDDGPAQPASSAPSPAALEWITHLPKGVQFDKRVEGMVRLSAAKSQEPVWAAVKVPRDGLYEIIVQIDRAGPGAGIYLGDEEGRPKHIVAVLRDRQSGQPALGFVRPDVASVETEYDPARQVAPLIGPGQWLRLVAGCGTVRCWTSGDGVHWGRALEPLRPIEGGGATVGLCTLKASDNAEISLRGLERRSLTALSKLTDPALVAQAPEAVATVSDFAEWSNDVDKRRPENVEAVAWRRACALAALARVPRGGPGNAILLGLLDDVIKSDASLSDRLQALTEATLLYDAWQQADAARLVQRFETLSDELVRAGDARPWSPIGRALLTAPICSPAPFQTMNDVLVRTELLGDIHVDRWADVDNFCRRLRFWNTAPDPDLRWPSYRQRMREVVDWAESVLDAARAEGRSLGGEALVRLSSAAQPLVVEVGKEAYGVIAELEARIAEQTWPEACQVIVAAPPELAGSLVPALGDPRLLVSFSSALDDAVRQSPGLRETMIERHGRQARLRLQQARLEENALEMHAVAVRFPATAAASEAWCWLGDRALVVGDFVSAESLYERALPSSDPDFRREIEARLRLTAAFQGRDEGRPVSESVSLQDRKLGAAEFERMVKETLAAAVAAGPGPSDFRADQLEPVSPARFTVKRHGKWTSTALPRGLDADGALDGWSRQLAWTGRGSTLFVSDGAQVQAFDVESAKSLWTRGLGVAHEPRLKWPVASMRATLAGDRLFVRRVMSSGPSLVCLDVRSGQSRWESNPKIPIVSDPLPIQGYLYAFAIAKASADPSSPPVFELLVIEPGAGSLRGQNPILGVRADADLRVPCQVTTDGRRLYGAAGGTVFACDLTGQRLWLRRQVWIPGAQATEQGDQTGSPPLLAGGRLIVFQPGTFAVECIDAASGHRIWTRTLPDVRRLPGLSGQRVIVETSRGLMALAIGTGAPLWSVDDAPLLDAQLCPENGDLLIARRVPLGAEQSRPEMVWIDPATGREKAIASLEALTDRQPMLGPLVHQKGRVWTFFGRPTDNSREILELVPAKLPPAEAGSNR